MDERLSDYLLGELPPGEHARFEAQLHQDPALRAEAERLAPVVARLETLDHAAWDLPPLPPLPALDSPQAERKPKQTPWWRRSLALRPLPAAALATLLLGVGVVAGTLAGGDGGDDGAPAGRVVALAPVPPEGGGAEGSATFASTGGRATVRVSGLPPSADGEFYELWLLNSAEDLVSLGSFDVPASGEIEVTVPVPQGAEEGFAALDISVEPGDGDPGHSARSVLRAPLQAS